jgi:hypothetical protein
MVTKLGGRLPNFAWIQRMANLVKPLRWIARGLAILGVVIYVLVALQMMDTKMSFLDEGLYLYKGILFASGTYFPFQAYGPWTNHMPLAYLIPGAVQLLFGPGLLTGRLFSIFAALLMMPGLWFVVRRFGGDWWAALAIWGMALSPAEIKLFTLGLPQSLTGCLFIWMLVFILGKRRHPYQIALGAFLAVVMIFVRENMAPVLLLIILYSFWQHGKKAGWIATAVGLATLIVGHAVFWPGIMQIWSGWLPPSLTPFLEPFRIQTEAVQFDMSFGTRQMFDATLLNFWLAIRLHPISFLAAFSTWLLWPKRERWEPTAYRAAVLLSGLFVLLWIEHAYVAFGGTTCIDCILLYVGYFDYLGIILLATAFPFLERKISWPRSVLISIFILLTSICISYSGYEDTGYPLTRILIPEFLSKLVLPGPTDIRRLLAYTHGFTGLQQRILLPSLAGLLSGLGILLLGGILSASFRKVLIRWRISYGSIVLAILMIVVLVLSPTVVLSAGNDFFACGSRTIQAYKDAAVQIQGIIGKDATVYWEGRSNALFLYLPDVHIFPPQLNHMHNFYLDGNADELLKMGLWNAELGRQWMREADFILIESTWLQEWEKEILELGNYILLAKSLPLGNCETASYITIYQKP